MEGISKNLLAAIVSCLVLNALGFSLTYLMDAVDNSRGFIVFLWCVVCFIGSIGLPIYFLTEEPFKD